MLLIVLYKKEKDVAGGEIRNISIHLCPIKLVDRWGARGKENAFEINAYYTVITRSDL